MPARSAAVTSRSGLARSELAARGLLGLLLAATLLGAVTLDRGDWPGLIGDEAAYLMQAESLAFDADLVYSGADYDRFVGHWGRAPEGLILQTGDGGETLTYGKPALYSLWLAPFVRLSPTRGAGVANALLLALAALAAAWALRPALGAAAPLWIAAFVFASVAFGTVFWAHSDLFLMCLTAIGLALLYGPGAAGGPGDGAGRRTGGGARPASPGPARRLRKRLTRTLARWMPSDGAIAACRWALAGALLAAVVLARPLYFPLLLPAAWATRELPAEPRRWGVRWRTLGALAAGGALLTLAATTASTVQRGSWTPYGGERMGFYSTTGFPEVDLPPGGWSAELERRPGSGSWVEREKLRFPLRPRLLAYDGLYFLAGSHVGVLPYFLPGLLGLLAWRPGGRRWPLAAAVALVVLAFFVVRPFNFYGGGAALANRYFLPVYPALWFLASPARPPGRWRWLAPVVVALAAAPFLAPLWSAPRAYPQRPEGGWRYVSDAARELLPYETTLDHLKPGGDGDVALERLWLRPLAPGLRGEPDTGGWLTVEPVDEAPPRADLLLASNEPLAALTIEAATGAPPLDFGGAAVLERSTSPGGVTRHRLAPRPLARHPMWWSGEQSLHLYRLQVDPGGDGPTPASPLRFRLLPETR